MRERGILFSDDMVRALLEGRKTQTRRLIKPQPNFTSKEVEELASIWPGAPLSAIVNQARASGFITVRCPFGEPGDRLWARECWASLSPKGRGPFVYRSDVPGGERVRVDAPWRPSIHMPRYASRILLRVLEVRVQRLQDITEEDAVAEGARRFDELPETHPYGLDPRWSMESPTSTEQCLGSARMAFANYINVLHGGRLWNCAGKPSLWDTNPWVWAVSFTVLEIAR